MKSKAICFLIITLSFSSIVFAKSSIKTKQIYPHLKSGEGGIAMGIKTYMEPKKFNQDKFKDFKSVDDIFANFEEKQQPLGVTVYFISPDKKKKEVQYYADPGTNMFLIMGQPGEYIFTRFVYFVGNYLYSKRIYQTIYIEPGKIKYLGDIVRVLSKKDKKYMGIVTNYNIDYFWDFEPTRIKDFLVKAYPFYHRYFVLEALKKPEPAQE
ncbi:hypothetical protein KJ708_05920 [bacterium]|nr:hypothetical protein [bacterium]MBU1917973.1 hypothetical protein [bacterium]